VFSEEDLEQLEEE